ncbi:MAG: zinc-dependent metalloprotease [Saprospiraceae bacterium]
MKKLFLIFLTLTGILTHNFAQNMSEICGTSDWKTITERLIENRRYMEAGHYNIDRSIVKYIPLKIHLIAKKDGSNRLSEAKVFENLCQLNKDYEDQNIVFYMADGSMSYINDNNAYTNQGNTFGVAALKAAKAKNAINIYFAFETPSLGSTLGGTTLGYYSPTNDWLVIRNDQVDNKSGTLSHELGHCFSLKHPFSGWDQESFLQWYAKKYSKAENWGAVPAWFKVSVVNQVASDGFTKIECFNGSNCASSGDLVCDTPADYNFGFGWSGCSPFTRKLIGPCDKDSIKDTMEDNFMAYFIGCAKYKFTNEQKALIQADYNSSRRAYIRSSYVPAIQPISQHAINHSPNGPIVVQYFDNVTLDWDDVPGADAYLVEIDRTSSLNSSGVQRYLVGNSSLTVFKLEASKSYFWRVIPYDAEGGTCLNLNDAVKAKFSTSAFTIGTSDISALNQWSVSPNPVSSGNPIRLSMNVGQDFEATIALYNAMGQEIKSIGKQQITAGNVQLTIETDGVSKGIYYVRLQSEKGIESKRVIIAD